MTNDKLTDAREAVQELKEELDEDHDAQVYLKGALNNLQTVYDLTGEEFDTPDGCEQCGGANAQKCKRNSDGGTVWLCDSCVNKFAGVRIVQ